MPRLSTHLARLLRGRWRLAAGEIDWSPAVADSTDVQAKLLSAESRAAFRSRR